MPNDKKWKLLLLAAAVLLTGANLRAPIIALGPLVQPVIRDLQVSAAFMGIVSTLPVLCFAAFSPTVPFFARKFGIERVMIASMAVLAVGILLRSAPLGIYGLLAGTILLSAAISAGNVLLPGVVKIGFPLQLGMMTGLFSVMMSLMAGLSSGLSVPIARHTGWPFAMSVWIVPALLALCAWVAVNRRWGRLNPPAPVSLTEPAPDPVRIWRSPLAWSLSLFMGLQSLLYYTLAGWLPSILIYKGVSPTQSGWLGSLMQWVGLPALIAATSLAGRIRNRNILPVVIGLCCAAGPMGIALAPASLLWLFVILAGVGTSGAFALCLMFFNMRTESPAEAARLSAMAQTVGYLIAAVGPVGAGILFDLSGGWTVPLTVLTLILLLECAFGCHCARDVTLRSLQASRKT